MQPLQLVTFGIVFSIFLESAFSQVELENTELGCLIGSYRHRNLCYAVSDDDEVTHDEAKIRCNDNGGSLAIIKDYETHVFLHRLRMRNFLHCYWFGLHDKKGEGKWFYEDGTKLEGYTNWGVGEPNNNGGVQDCASLLMHKNLTWDDEFCYMNFLYVCEFPESECSSKSNIFGKTCYEPSRHFAPYDEAKNKCKTRGGQLALIKSKEVDAFIRGIIFNDTFWLTMNEDEIKDVYAGLALKFTWIKGSWIGIQHSNSWLRDDNTTANFTRWPKDESTSSKRRCVTLGKRMNPYSCGIYYSYGKTDYSHQEIEACYEYTENWNPADCSDRNSYICQYPADISKSGPAIDGQTDDIQSNGSNTHFGTAGGYGTTNDDTLSNKVHKYEALEDNGNIQGGIHLGIVPFILLIISCLLIGIMLTILTYGIYKIKRSGGNRTYQSALNLMGSSEADP